MASRARSSALAGGRHLALVAVLVGCGGGGVTASPSAPPGTLETPGTPVTAPSGTPGTTGPSPTDTPRESTMPETLTLRSPEFDGGSAIPARYTCDGDDVSPPLAWSGAPEAALSMALVVTDPDARGFVHWVAYNIDASASAGLPAAWASDAAFQGRNDFGRIGYGGPCPPSGTHRYDFRLLALDTLVDLGDDPTAAHLLTVAAGHIVAEAILEGTYARR